MALVFHMQAQPGDSVPTDLVTGNPPTIDAGMNLSLEQDGARWVWRVPDTAVNHNCTWTLAGTFTSSPATAGSGITMIVRMRTITVVNTQSNLVTSRGPTTPAPHRFRRDSSLYQAYVPFVPNTYLTGFDMTTDMRTVVIKNRMASNGPNTANLPIWFDKPVEGNGTPDYAGSDHSTSENLDISGARMLGLAGNEYLIADFLLYDEELADVDCESAAFDLDSWLGVAPGNPPTLTNPTGTATGQTTANGGVDTDQLSEGTLDIIASTSATPPSEAQLKAGQESGGGAAPWSSLSQAVTGANPQTWSATGLTAATNYYFYSGHTNAAAEFSNIAASAQFTTDAGAAVQIVFLEPLKQFDGQLWASLGSLSVRVMNDNFTTVIWQTDAGITDANGILAPITDPALVQDTWYRVVVFDPTRTSRIYRIQAMLQ